MDAIQKIEEKWIQKQVPPFRVGDTVDVHVRIVEETMSADAGAKKKTAKKEKEEKRERVQIFSGVVIADRHDRMRRTFTVRRIVQGEWVERVFPVYSPTVAKIQVKKSGIVRRAKLYYLRDLAGKAARLVEKKSVKQFGELVAATPPPPAAVPSHAPAVHSTGS